MPGNEKVTWQMTSMTGNAQANIQSDGRNWRPWKWMVSLLLAAVAIGTLVVLQAGPPASDGYRPTDRTLEALELDKAGKEEEAYQIYLEEAKNGDRFAQFAVGSMRVRGDGIDRDMGTALQWHRKAARQGQLGSQYSLARIYLDIEGYRDRDLGLKWLNKAAELDDARAQYALALEYLEGRNVNKDIDTGLAWLRKAAEQDYPRARNKLAALYEIGDVVDRDLDKAMEFYEQSAELGAVYALRNLARLTEHYDTLTNTRLDIYKWNYILEDVGASESAHKKRKALESRMGSWDIARARGRAELWLFLHGDEFQSRDSRE